MCDIRYVCERLNVNAQSECASVRINQLMLQEQLQNLDGLKQSDFMSHSCDMSLGLSRAVLCVIGFTPGPKQREREW